VRWSRQGRMGLGERRAQGGDIQLRPPFITFIHQSSPLPVRLRVKLACSVRQRQASEGNRQLRIWPTDNLDIYLQAYAPYRVLQRSFACFGLIGRCPSKRTAAAPASLNDDVDHRLGPSLSHHHHHHPSHHQQPAPRPRTCALATS
jgi:hypothetical protein